MPQPDLISPVQVVIEAAQREASAATRYDQDAREPRRSIKRVQVIVPAQVSIGSSRNSNYRPSGVSEDVTGYLVVRIVDCQEAGYSPARGDRVVQIGSHANVGLYVVAYEPCGHWDDEDGATLTRIYLVNRRPSADQPAM